MRYGGTVHLHARERKDTEPTDRHCVADLHIELKHLHDLVPFAIALGPECTGGCDSYTVVICMVRGLARSSRRRESELIHPVTTVSDIGNVKGDTGMWLFIPEGFYSIVTAEEFGYPLQVRARCEEDLDRLRKSYLPKLGSNVALPDGTIPGAPSRLEMIWLKDSQRSFRLSTTRNFKNEVAVPTLLRPCPHLRRGLELLSKD